MNTYITNIDDKWYAFAGDPNKNEVYSIGADCPVYGGQWFGRWTKSGIKYVSTASSSRNGAYKKARRHGNYCGAV